MLLRMFRLLRIPRIFRLFRMFKQLYILVTGFMESFGAIFWVSVLCSLCLYVCAIVLTRMLGHPAKEALKEEKPGDPSEEEANIFLKSRSGDIKLSMFSLFELMAHPDMAPYEIIFEQ